MSSLVRRFGHVVAVTALLFGAAGVQHASAAPVMALADCQGQAGKVRPSADHLRLRDGNFSAKGTGLVGLGQDTTSDGDLAVERLQRRTAPPVTFTAIDSGYPQRPGIVPPAGVRHISSLTFAWPEPTPAGKPYSMKYPVHSADGFLMNAGARRSLGERAGSSSSPFKELSDEVSSHGYCSAYRRGRRTAPASAITCPPRHASHGHEELDRLSLWSVRKRCPRKAER